MMVRILIVPLLALTALGLSSARADMLVLESNVPAIKQGAHLADDFVPDLAPGGHVKVLLLGSGETKVVEKAGGVSSARGPNPIPGGIREVK
jgi:hypothetical protein